jgi:hypothetical protein
MKHPDYFDTMDDGESVNPNRHALIERCARCRSEDVRWRQQGGKWVLFSLTPGQVHVCEIDASEFGPV